MKHIIIILLIFSGIPIIFAQSPNFEINMRFEEEMYHGDTCQSLYFISVNRYFLKANIPHTDLYSNDTSDYDWKSFSLNKTNDFEVIRMTERTYNSYVFQFLYTEKNFVFENIILFTVIREKCGEKDTMKFYFPITISSFNTSLNLRPVYFKKGIFDLTDAVTYFKKDNNYIIITIKDNTNFDNYIKKD